MPQGGWQRENCGGIESPWCLAEVIAEPVAVSQTLSRPHRQDAGHKEFLVIIEHGPRADQGEQQCKAGGE